MTKFKKIVSTFALAVMLILSSTLLIACGKGATSGDTLTLINQSLEEYKEDTTFKAGAVYGATTNFFLNDFQEKQSTGDFAPQDEKSIAIVANGLNFIEKYSTYLNGLDVKYDFGKLNKKINEMDKAFKDLQTEHFNLSQVESSANYNIYNGYFARYALSAREFAENVYDVAITLGDLLFVKEDIINAGATSAVITYDLGYQELLINADFKNFFFGSAQGRDFDKDLYNTAESIYEKYCQAFVLAKTKEINADEYQGFVSVVNAVNGDRANANKSLKEFSLYEYYLTYEGSLIAYEKSNNDASIYHNNVQSYFGNNGILSKFFTFLLV